MSDVNDALEVSAGVPVDVDLGADEDVTPDISASHPDCCHELHHPATVAAITGHVLADGELEEIVASAARALDDQH